MRAGDFDFAARLSNMEDWDNSSDDFRRILRVQPRGSFVATEKERRVGIVTAISYGRLGWIGNVVVSKRYRKLGIGSWLVKHAILYLREKGARTIGLFSYKRNLLFYQRLGFKRDASYLRLIGKGRALTSEGPRSIDSRDFKRVLAFDRKYFRHRRDRLLRELLTRFRDSSFVTMRNGEVLGYIIGKNFDTTCEVGPWLCSRKDLSIAAALLRAVLNTSIEKPVEITVPRRNRQVLSLLRNHSFKDQGSVVRMYCGDRTGFPDDRYTFAAESLEKG
jgi:ribosomal protein S18 acetylase RimI-like enzyme